jgi:uncharacterized membrane protein
MNFDFIISVFCVICIVILFIILKIRTGSFSLKTSTKNISQEEMDKRIQRYNDQVAGEEEYTDIEAADAQNTSDETNFAKTLQ